MKLKKVYVLDLETCNSENNILQENTRVWLWDICDITTFSHTTGNNIETLIEKLKEIAPATIYTHNLKFDGLFIMDYIMKHGFKYSEKKSLHENEFTTLITNINMFYSMTICFEAKNKKTKKQIEFRDSSKKIKGTVRQIAIDYNLPILKGEIDYTLDRDENYVATPEEIKYIHNDTEIIARVLNIQYDQGLNRLTIASDVFDMYKKFCGTKFKYLFPTLPIEIDDFIRESYRGGICLVNEKYKNRMINDVKVYDVNSMHAYQMSCKLLPYSHPEYYKGKYVTNKVYPLYIQKIKVCCKLKENHIPTILLEELWFKLDAEYLVDTAGEMVQLTLTNVDLELLFEHYEIFDIKYIDGFMFMGSHNLFRNFIQPIYNKKCISSGAIRETNKMLLVGLYGKFATSPRHKKKIPYIENNVICFMNTELEVGEPVYTAVSAFISAYARQELCHAIQANYDNFIYCDTDSIHLTQDAKGIEIDNKKLGAWKFESASDPIIQAMYLAPKTYMQLTQSFKENKKISGCPDTVKRQINFDNFKYNQSFNGKLMPKKVNGGVVLVDNVYTIRMC